MLSFDSVFPEHLVECFSFLDAAVVLLNQDGIATLVVIRSTFSVKFLLVRFAVSLLGCSDMYCDFVL